MRTASMLTLLVLLGLAAGAACGEYLLFDPIAPIDSGHWTFVAGDLVLVRPLLLVGVPLVLAATVSAAAKIDQPPRFGLALAGTLVYFAITMLLAASLGAAAATLLRPGDMPAEAREVLRHTAAADFEAHSETSGAVGAVMHAGQDNLPAAWMTVLRRALPANLVDEVARGRLLGLIVLAILVGLAVAMTGARARPVAVFFDALTDVLLRIVWWIAWASPIGVLLLVANAVGTHGLRDLAVPWHRYLVVVGGALAAHMFIVLPVIMLLAVRRSPVAYLARCGRALAVAFATASSLVTLPVALEAALARGPAGRGRASGGGGDRKQRQQQQQQGRRLPPACSRAAAGLVLPLGANLNLNGTALFQAASVVFLCQVNDLDLSISELMVIVITATLAAITTAGVPSAALVTMIIVISAVNTSLAASGKATLGPGAIGALIGVDRLLDMARTAVNVWGNLVGAKIITSIAPDDPAEPLGFTTENTENTEKGKREGNHG